MADDWDPFADPSDTPASEPPCAPAKPTTADNRGYTASHAPVALPALPSDIYAALEVTADHSLLLEDSRRLGTPETPKDFAALLDRLFELPACDGNSEAVSEAFRPIAIAIYKNPNFRDDLFKRFLSVLENVLENKGDQKHIFAIALDFLWNYTDYKLGRSMPQPVPVNEPVGVETNGDVVFLFGWGGGTVEDLQDMHDLYRSLSAGATIVRSPCAGADNFGLRVQVALVLQAAAKTWADLPTGGPKPKLLVHLFSNAGGMQWIEVMRCWKELSARGEAVPHLDAALPPLSEVLRGVIYDSAVDTAINKEAAMVSDVQGVAPYLALLAQSMHDGSEEGKKQADLRSKRVLMACLSSNSPLYVHLREKPEKAFTKSHSPDGRSLHALEPPVPMQFICSKDDKVIPLEGVQKYMAEVNARSNRKGHTAVRKLVFEKSKHALHKIAHKAEYEECVKHFATTVLAS